MAGRLAGKVAIITGAGGGIGRACSLAFAREGASVVLAEVNPDSGKETAEAVRAAGGSVLFAQTDVSNTAEVQATVEKTIQTFGGLDIVFNIAGGSLEEEQGAADTPEEIWQKTYNTNLFGTFLFTKYSLRHMLQQKRGVVICTSSTAGIVGAWKKHAYAASKAGIIGFVRAIALEYAAQGIRANAICPGVTLSPKLKQRLGDDPARAENYKKRQPLGLCEPEDIAAGAVFLASDEARMITGQYLVIDGGRILDTGRAL